ncbi:hypothetical protein B0T10DRAFT_181977 [Thelonectria olida]|uniref:Uncharacterized protein n=1 Tax=Thelonectria olida TaxID=1576542 RepID=A0A9P8WFF2_9HYPO|nr:hypothetical protein B0T10DRAFT_181977 [Thelonectria olida]
MSVSCFTTDIRLLYLEIFDNRLRGRFESGNARHRAIYRRGLILLMAFTVSPSQVNIGLYPYLQLLDTCCENVVRLSGITRPCLKYPQSAYASHPSEASVPRCIDYLRYPSKSVNYFEIVWGVGTNDHRTCALALSFLAPRFCIVYYERFPVALIGWGRSSIFVEPYSSLLSWCCRVPRQATRHGGEKVLAKLTVQLRELQHQLDSRRRLVTISPFSPDVCNARFRAHSC